MSPQSQGPHKPHVIETKMFLRPSCLQKQHAGNVKKFLKPQCSHKHRVHANHTLTSNLSPQSKCPCETTSRSNHVVCSSNSSPEKNLSPRPKLSLQTNGPLRQLVLAAKLSSQTVNADKLSSLVAFCPSRHQSFITDCHRSHHVLVNNIPATNMSPQPKMSLQNQGLHNQIVCSSNLSSEQIRLPSRAVLSKQMVLSSNLSSQLVLSNMSWEPQFPQSINALASVSPPNTMSTQTTLSRNSHVCATKMSSRPKCPCNRHAVKNENMNVPGRNILSCPTCFGETTESSRACDRHVLVITIIKRILLSRDGPRKYRRAPVRLRSPVIKCQWPTDTAGSINLREDRRFFLSRGLTLGPLI